MIEQDEPQESPPPHGYARDGRTPGGNEGDPTRGTKIAAGVAFGIGSAALVAALLYAGRRKPKGKNDPK